MEVKFKRDVARSVVGHPLLERLMLRLSLLCFSDVCCYIKIRFVGQRTVWADHCTRPNRVVPLRLHCVLNPILKGPRITCPDPPNFSPPINITFNLSPKPPARTTPL